MTLLVIAGTGAGPAPGDGSNRMVAIACGIGGCSLDAPQAMRACQAAVSARYLEFDEMDGVVEACMADDGFPFDRQNGACTAMAAYQSPGCYVAR